MAFLYNLGLAFYGLALQIASIFNPKAKKWIVGRKNWQSKLQKAIHKTESVTWFHCASLGEFEQGRPLIEKIKSKYPERFILLTFFSPSGYEIRKNYAYADYICYLPLDSKQNAKKFIAIAQPKIALFIKYEFWANYLFQLKKNNIPTYSISTLFRKEQHFFKSKSAFSNQILAAFTHFFVQNNESKKLLDSIGFNNTTISGDTRYDRVAENASKVKPISILAQFCENSTCLVIGSSWSTDENRILPLVNSGEIDEKVIIAPHEVDETHIASICRQLKVPFKKYSDCTTQTDLKNIQVLIIDSIGLLANAYFYGTYAYIGGAFGNGLHNILEPAVFGLPVVFGPKHKKFPEAQLFIDEGIGFSISNVDEFEQSRTYILKNHAILKEKSTHFMQNRTGASACILEKLNL